MFVFHDSLIEIYLWYDIIIAEKNTIFKKKCVNVFICSHIFEKMLHMWKWWKRESHKNLMHLRCTVQMLTKRCNFEIQIRHKNCFFNVDTPNSSGKSFEIH